MGGLVASSSRHLCTEEVEGDVADIVQEDFA